MVKDNSHIQQKKAVVKQIDGDNIHVLMEYNDDGESTLCSLPKSCWANQDIALGQKVLIEWDRTNLDGDVVVEVVDTPLSIGGTHRIVEYARELLGIYPGDKILIVVGPNRQAPVMILKKLYRDIRQAFETFFRTAAPSEGSVVNNMVFKTAGWGELMLLTRLLPDLHTLGVHPRDIEYKLCETTARRFEPQKYEGKHIIFLGSPKSNEVLEEHYWQRLDLLNEYTFLEASLELRRKRNGSEADVRRYRTVEDIKDNAMECPEETNVEDHFLLAKTRNPFSDERKKRNCLLFCGTGTIGTGYAGLTAGGQQSIRQLYHMFGNQPFEIIGRVDMKGWFNPESDPVHCVYDGRQDTNILLLPRAMVSPRISDPDESYTDEDFRQDMQADPSFAAFVGSQ